MRTDSMQTAVQPALGVALVSACLLLVPLVAMQFTDAVNWDLADFVVAGALLFATGLTYTLIAKRRGNIAYRVAVGAALAGTLFLIWMNLAVGIIGSGDNPANLMYIGVLAVGVIGAATARFKPRGMANTMFAMALAQALVAVIALVAGLGLPENPPLEIVLVNGFFVTLFVASGWLFWQAARAHGERGTA